VEEESSADTVIQKLKIVGETGPGLFLLDKDLARRVFTSPAASGGWQRIERTGRSNNRK
jgi:ferritin